MKYYFVLQFKRSKRWFEEAGISPAVGIILLIVLFVLFSKSLFFKSELAKWIYPFLSISYMIKMGNNQSNRQLEIIYNKTNFLLIRMVENGIVALPFIFYLLYEQQFIIVAGLILAAVLSGVINFNFDLNTVIPTPFRKFPFENIIGFRKSFLLIGLIYFLIFKAIQVDNFNLGIVSLGVIFLIFMSFHFKPEKSFFVWIFGSKASVFLKRKLIDSIICVSILALPALLSLLIFFPDRFLILIVVFIVGIVFLSSMVLAKYSAYPHEMNLPQGILYALSLWFPPMLFIMIPLFYKKSIKNLKSILG